MHYLDRRMSVLCVTGNRRYQFLLEETPSFLPSPYCQSVQLPPSSRRCANNHLSKRQAYRECFIPYGLLLYPTPDYPKCVATLLSVIQTEVLLDKIRESDLTSFYKKSMAEWKAFIGQ